MKRQCHCAFVLLALMCAGLFTATPVQAVMFAGSLGSLAASAEFTLDGDDLKIHLVNTSLTPVGDNPNVLTGIYFDLAGNPALTAGSVALDATSFYTNTSNNSVALPLGDHWAYGSGTGGDKPAGYGFYGVGACGFGIFGPHQTFTGNGGSPSGVNYGLISEMSASASNGFKNQGPQIGSGIDIILNGALSELPDITNVRFQYGSSTTTETSFIAVRVPEPHTAVLLLSGAVGLAFRRRIKVTSSR
jgi:hypothetical protein